MTIRSKFAMDREAKAESILDFLTARNPDIHHQTTKSTSLTSVRNSLYPREMKLWKDFNFSTLETVYGKRLIHEARKGRPSLVYPSVLRNIDDVVHDEPTTTHVLTVWNHRIVAASLQAVQDTLHPSIWVPCRRKGQDAADAIILDVSTGEKTTRLKPDAGAVSFCQGCCSEVERLPKDYKPASKWHSSTVFGRHMTDEAGEWGQGQANRNNARPIRQVYTYCVELGCRYGCIITTREAFIFRIQPRTEEPDSSTAGGCRSRKAALKKALSTDGLMEYVSIPWENHRRANSDDCGAMTVNLALWFVHILAGNSHEVAWRYPELCDEKLTTGICTINTPETSRPKSGPGPGPELESERFEPSQTRRSLGFERYSRKRRRDSDTSDRPNYSFAAASESFGTRFNESFKEESTRGHIEAGIENDRETDAGWGGTGFVESLPEQHSGPKRLRSGKVI